MVHLLKHTPNSYSARKELLLATTYFSKIYKTIFSGEGGGPRRAGVGRPGRGWGAGAPRCRPGAGVLGPGWPRANRRSWPARSDAVCLLS